MELFDAIYSRRSVRLYKPDRIPAESVKKIVDAGRWAPSACNVQGWRFIVIDDPRVKRALIDLGAASFLENAPMCMVVLYDNQTDNLEYADYVQSAAACIQNMLLAAHSIGIGGCWICHLPRKKDIRKLLRVPGHYDPIACVALGYPRREPGKRERTGSLEDLISYNRFEAGNERPRPKISLAAKRIARKVYYLLPFRKHLAKKADERFEKKF